MFKSPLITNQNYSIALKITRERYVNKQVLISSYMEVFVKLQPITSMENVSGLRAKFKEMNVICQWVKFKEMYIIYHVQVLFLIHMANY